VIWIVGQFGQQFNDVILTTIVGFMTISRDTANKTGNKETHAAKTTPHWLSVNP